MKKFIVKWLDDENDIIWSQEEAKDVSDVIQKYSKFSSRPVSIFEISGEWTAKVDYIKVN